jgi:hypothetical protein
VAGAWSWLLTSIQCRGQECWNSLSHMSSKRGTQLPNTANLFLMILVLMAKGSHDLAHCTRVGTSIVATIYLQLMQNRYMFRSFTFDTVPSLTSWYDFLLVTLPSIHIRLQLVLPLVILLLSWGLYLEMSVIYLCRCVGSIAPYRGGICQYGKEEWFINY